MRNAAVIRIVQPLLQIDVQQDLDHPQMDSLEVLGLGFRQFEDEFLDLLADP